MRRKSWLRSIRGKRKEVEIQEEDLKTEDSSNQVVIPNSESKEGQDEKMKKTKIKKEKKNRFKKAPNTELKELSKCAENIEKILKKAKKMTRKKKEKFLPKWSAVNRLNFAVNSLRELLE